MVLKITVPKGKVPGERQDVAPTLKSLGGRYKAEVVGFVDHTVRFRGRLHSRHQDSIRIWRSADLFG